MAREITGISTSGTLYARLRKTSNGYWWNGSSLEAYSSGNYSNYDIAMTEEGNSGVYTADFPTALTTSGTYEYFVHRQSGGSPAEGDVIVNTGKIDWTGSSSISSSTGSMSGSDCYDYILRRGWKRTDKSAEVYECITDAIQEMRRRFMFDEAENETTTTDTIATLGDFKLDLESDFGLLLGIVLEDDDTGTPLKQISKSQFDQLYSSINVEADRGYPEHFCIYNGQIYIGPRPDQTSYVYRISYSRRAGTVTSSTTGVPFTNLYRDILADNVLSRLYTDVNKFDLAAQHKQRFEEQMVYAMRRERMNSGEGFFNVRPFGC